MENGGAPRAFDDAQGSLCSGRTGLGGGADLELSDRVQTGCGAGKALTLAPGERLQAGKNRVAQVVRAGGRAYFQGKRRTEFLEWFAASGSVAWSARKAGVNDKTVWKHRMNDPAFAEAFDRAQEQGVARAKALLLEGRRSAERIDVAGDWQAPELADFDAALLAKIVFDDRARRRGEVRGGAAPKVASNAEVEAALAKRVALYGARVRAQAAREGAACPVCGEAFAAAPAAADGEGSAGA